MKINCILFLVALCFQSTVSFGQGTVDVPAKELGWTNRVVQTAAIDSAILPVITKVAFRPGHHQAVLVGDDHVANLVDLNTGRIIQSMKGHTSWVRCAVFTPDGSRVLTAGTDRRILEWDIKKDSWKVFARQPAAVEGIALSADGKFLATVGFDNQLRVYNTTNSVNIFSATAPCNDMRCVAFSPSGMQLAAGGRSGVVRSWKRTDAGKGENQWRQQSNIKAHSRRVHAIKFLGENVVLSGGEDRNLQKVDLQTSKASLLATMSGRVFDLEVLPNGMIASCGANNQIDLLDHKTGKSLGFLEGHSGTVSCLAVSKTKILSGSYDTQVRLWSVPVDTQNTLTQKQPASFDIPALERSAGLTKPNGLVPIRRRQ